MKRIAFLFACLLTTGVALADGQWVGTWGTAPQLVESHNNPPSPGLGNNSLRQIVQVSVGGEKVRLKLMQSQFLFENDYGEALWIEAEGLRTGTLGTAFQLVDDAAASGGQYLKTVDQVSGSAPADDAHRLLAEFNASKADTYYIYARVLCPTWDDDSYWVGVDSPMNNFVNGLQTSSWDWKELYHGNTIIANHHERNVRY